jgi:hypothetical protein
MKLLRICELDIGRTVRRHSAQLFTSSCACGWYRRFDLHLWGAERSAGNTRRPTSQVGASVALCTLSANACTSLVSQASAPHAWRCWTAGESLLRSSHLSVAESSFLSLNRPAPVSLLRRRRHSPFNFTLNVLTLPSSFYGEFTSIKRHRFFDSSAIFWVLRYSKAFPTLFRVRLMSS